MTPPPRTPTGPDTAPPPRPRPTPALDASRAALALFLRARSTDFSVEALAEHAGPQDLHQAAERTFYRSFPRKEDAIRPYLRAALDQTLDHGRAAPGDRPLAGVLVDAHARLSCVAPLGPALFARP